MKITDTIPVNPALAITTIDPDGLNGMAVSPLRMLELVQAMDDKKREIYTDKTEFDAGEITQIISYVVKTPAEFANLVFMSGQKMSDNYNKLPNPSVEEMRERVQIMRDLLDVGQAMNDMLAKAKQEDEEAKP